MAQANNVNSADVLRALGSRAFQLAERVMQKQRTYMQLHARYWSCLLTHDSPPADGASKPPNLKRRPKDGHSAEDVGLALDDYPVAFQCVAYEVERVHGYELTMRVVINGEPWECVINEGPEGHRARPWGAVARSAGSVK